MRTLLTDRTGRFSALKTLMLASLLMPALWLGWRAGLGDLGPLPLKELLHRTGDWAVRFLVFTLALSPLQWALKAPRLSLIRRMAGVGSFAYAFAHLLLYVANSNFKIAFVVGEIAFRFYLTIGFAALAGLAALALTSTDSMIRRLGPRWKTLHRLVYAIAVLALLHFVLQSKIDVSQAITYSGLFLLAMLCRLALRLKWRMAPLPIVALAALAGLATAGIEAGWYGLATGVDPWRVLNANFMLAHGLRPAITVALSGFALAGFTLVYPALHAFVAKRLPLPVARTRETPARARSSAG